MRADAKRQISRWQEAGRSSTQLIKRVAALCASLILTPLQWETVARRKAANATGRRARAGRAPAPRSPLVVIIILILLIFLNLYRFVVAAAVFSSESKVRLESIQNPSRIHPPLLKRKTTTNSTSMLIDSIFSPFLYLRNQLTVIHITRFYI